MMAGNAGSNPVEDTEDTDVRVLCSMCVVKVERGLCDELITRTSMVSTDKESGLTLQLTWALL